MRLRRQASRGEGIPRRSLNPFPPIQRAIRRFSLTTIDERTLLAGVVGVAMVLSYGGLYDFARKYDLRYPELFPVAIDLGAVAAARVAMKLTKLNHKGGTVRTFSVGLVVLSVSLNVSTVELPAFPAVATAATVAPWLWVTLPPIVGHGAPAVIAAVLFELVLLLQRVGNRRRPSMTEMEKPKPTLQPERTHVVELAKEKQEPASTTSSRSTRSVDDLAQEVSVYLMKNELKLTRRQVESTVREIEGSCSGARATTILNLIKGAQ